MAIRGAGLLTLSLAATAKLVEVLRYASWGQAQRNEHGGCLEPTLFSITR
jgi:hypothetical protein